MLAALAGPALMQSWPSLPTPPPQAGQDRRSRTCQAADSHLSRGRRGPPNNAQAASVGRRSAAARAALVISLSSTPAPSNEPQGVLLSRYNQHNLQRSQQCTTTTQTTTAPAVIAPTTAPTPTTTAPSARKSRLTFVAGCDDRRATAGDVPVVVRRRPVVSWTPHYASPTTIRKPRWCRQ